MKLFSVISSLLLISSANAATLWTPAASPERSGSAQLVRLDASIFDATSARSRNQVDLVLPDGTALTLDVFAKQQSLVAPGATGQIVRDSGTVTVPLPQVRTIYGECVAIPGTLFHLTDVGGTVSGSLSMPTGRWLIVPDRDAAGRATGLTAVLDAAQSATGQAPTCGVVGKGMTAQEEAAIAASVLDASYGAERLLAADRQIDVAFEATNQFYIANGSDADRCFAYVLALMAEVSAAYEAQTQTNYRVIAIRVFDTSNQPYGASDSTGYLNQLTQLAQSHEAPAAFHQADAVHLVHTTLPLFSVGLGGLAWLDSLCAPPYNTGFSDIFAAYSFPSTSFNTDVDMVAHELGHNCGSEHTHCYEPPIDRCYAGEEGCYSGTPVPGTRTIMSYCDNFNNALMSFDPRVAAVIRGKVLAAPCVMAPAGTPTATATPTPVPCVGGCDPVTVLGNLNGTYWEAKSLPGIFDVPNFTFASNGLNIGAQTGSTATFGSFETRNTIRLSETGTYRFAFNLIPSAGIGVGKRHPECRIRVFTPDALYQRSVSSAESGPTALRSTMPVYVEANAGDEVKIAIDILAFDSTIEGSFTVNSITLTKVQ